MSRRHFLGQTALAGLGLVGGALRVHAQTQTPTPTPSQTPSRAYPNRPITFVVPFAAGGGGDLVARLLAKALSDRIGNPVVVENRVGAGGNLGTAHVLKSPPDGYTLLNMSSSYPIQAAVSKLPFDPLDDVQPIMMVSKDPAILLVHPAAPWRDARDLTKAAQAAPATLSYGSAGVGSLAHLGMEELALQMGVQFLHVPYKGTAQALNDLLGRNIQMALAGATVATPYLKSGRVRALGIAGRQRLASLPDVPTFAEQGHDFQVVDWKAIAGPKGLPAEVVAFLNRELNEVLRAKGVAEKFIDEGTTALGGSPEQMMQTIKADVERWRAVVRKAGVKLD